MAYQKLLTKEILKKLPKLYATQEQKDPSAIVKFFTPWTNWTWYATEGSPVDADGYYDTDKPKIDFLFFGWVEGHEKELGYFSLTEIQSIRGTFGLKVERDQWFDPTPLSKIRGHAA
jgi:hypothetical protein